MLSRVTKVKKAVALLVALSIVSPTFNGDSFAANQAGQTSDIKGHWAEAKIQEWIDEGLIRGYQDGSFKPDKQMTRAEFMSLVNASYKYTAEAEISFTDVPEDAWYYEAVAIARAAGYMNGYSDNTIRPQNPITRQEAAKIIASINELELDEEAANAFIDAASIAAWSKGYVGAVAGADIMNGFGDQSFRPLKQITRAEAVAALDNALDYQESVTPTPTPEAEVEPEPTASATPAPGTVVNPPVVNPGTSTPTVTKPSKPVGTTNELNVPVPDVTYPLPAVKNGQNAADGTLKNIAATNPFINILGGFDKVWSLNQPSWTDGTAATIIGASGRVANYGDGPDVYYDGYKNNAAAVVADKQAFANVEIRNSEAWVANIKYVEDVTQNRTDEEALAAYYDDQRDKIYGVMDALGPLANKYVDTVGATTAVKRDISEMNVVLEEETVEDESQGIGANWQNTELADMVKLIDLFRFRIPASSNPSKYFYSSPRPWRMNSLGEVKEVVDANGLAVWTSIGSGAKAEEALSTGGTKATGKRNYQQYETNVEIIPALQYVRRIAEDGAGKDGAFPSGHTSAGYLSSFGFAIATPERFSEFLTRAAQYGENRIVTGMHSPFDVIGGRIQATAMVAYALNQPENREILENAYQNTGEVFGALAEAKNMSLYDYAHAVTDAYTFESAYGPARWENLEANKALYREKMTSGIPQTGEKGLAPVVPEGAEVLLEMRQPYLTAEQRREVLYTTELDSGYPVIDESNGWGRIDLVMAADGYGAFLDNVTVNMDASKGRFHARDWWRNHISGSGMLTKQGTGTLSLTGNNTYTGGTLLEGGTLIAESASAFGQGDLYVENGTVEVRATGALNIAGNLTMNAGTLKLAMDQENNQVNVAGTLYLDGGNLNLDFSNLNIEDSATITLITAGKMKGQFNSVMADGYNVSLTYEANRIVARVVAVN
ncbi:S-layer homology domain-containing protein [Paenibacillus sp. CAU 1782]